MLADEIDQVAKAIYATHWRKPSPDWEEASEAVRDWVRAQALSAINATRSLGWRRVIDREPATAARTSTE